MSSNYPADWNRRRKDVLQRDGFQCQNCSALGGPKGSTELHVHHIVPKSRGGSHDVSNLSTICKDCHLAIHNERKTASTTSSKKAASTTASKNTHYNKTVDKEHKLRIKTRRESKWYGLIFGIIIGFSSYIYLNLSFGQYMTFSSVLIVILIYILHRILEYWRDIDVEFKKVFTR